MISEVRETSSRRKRAIARFPASWAQQVDSPGTTDQAAPVASRVRRALLRHVTEQTPGVGRRPLTGKPVDHA